MKSYHRLIKMLKIIIDKIYKTIQKLIGEFTTSFVFPPESEKKENCNILVIYRM